MHQRFKALLIGGTLLIGSFGPAVALAQTSATPSKAQAMPEPAFKGSIALPQDNQSEEGEAAAYGSMAKVTLEQAVKAAQDSLDVTSAAVSAQLGNENGFLVWEVVVGTQTVKIDAGDAKVLQTEQVGAAETKDDEEPYDQEDAQQDESDQADAQAGQNENDQASEEQDMSDNEASGQQDEQGSEQERQNEGGAEDDN